MTNVCSKCGEEKSVKEFHRKGYNKDGSVKYRSCCKDCFKEYYKENKEAILDQQAEYYKENSEYILKQQKEYHKSKKKVA